MKLKIGLGLVIILLVVPVMGRTVTRFTTKQNRFIFGHMLYIQDLEDAVSDSYPDWSPGESICPVNAGDALRIASEAVTNLVLNAAVDRDEVNFSLFENGGNWFYDIRMGLVATNGAPESWSRAVNIIVGMNGEVVKMTRKPNERREIGKGFRRAVPQPVEKKEPMRQLTPEEQAKKREEVRENLREYQMAVIRAGMPPMPIPLTQDMDDQLVKEGILPPDVKRSEQPPLANSSTNSVSDRKSSPGFQPN